MRLHGLRRTGLLVDEFDDLVDARGDRPVFLRAEDLDLRARCSGRERRRLLRLEAADAFLDALEAVHRALKLCLGRPAHGGAGRLLAAGQLLVEGAADDAGIRLLGVAEQPGVVDVLAGETELGSGGGIRSRREQVMSRLALALKPSPSLLRRVVFIGQPALGLCLDLERIRLGAVRRCDQLVVGALGPCEAGRALRGVVGEGGGILGLEHFRGGPRVGKAAPHGRQAAAGWQVLH